MTSHRPRPPSKQNVNPFAALEDALPERPQQQLQSLHLAPSPATAATLQPYAKLKRNILQNLVQERDISHLLETACDDSSLEEALQSATVAQLIQVLQLADSMVSHSNAQPPPPSIQELHAHVVQLRVLLHKQAPPLHLAPVLADGSCFYYALALQIDGMLSPGYHDGCTGQQQCDCFVACSALREQTVQYVIDNYDTDEHLQLLMQGRLQDCGCTHVEPGDILRQYAVIMRSKHTMTDVLEQYVCSRFLKRDILTYDADKPATFPCLEYIDHSSYPDDPVRIQYSRRLQHFNAIVSSERMAHLHMMSNVCLQSGGLSIIFSNAFSRVVVHDAGHEQCPASGPSPAVPVHAHKTSAAFQAGIAPELHSSDSFSDSALPGEHINKSLSVRRWRVYLCSCAHINTTNYICVRVRILTLHIIMRIFTLHIILILYCTLTRFCIMWSQSLHLWNEPAREAHIQHLPRHNPLSLRYCSILHLLVYPWTVYCFLNCTRTTCHVRTRFGIVR